ncbi:hypothetical protein EVG20_g7261 [Dentipellis fragilis]|uniref:C2H2-type domain-containing protein n=1 Tax=Dentipellis fragilis TaxID=205917 RepID=A0A4Y9YF94_9AGAM|nr:hypothetical protein EVG20_g7261 [Dentipellis fragilis]
MPPPLEGDPAYNVNYNYMPGNMTTLSSGQYQHPVAQGELDARGGYVFANPGTHAGYAAAPHEPVSLMRRPIEDIYCMTPQVPFNGAHTCPDIHNMRAGPYECRRNLSPTSGHPPAIPYMPQRGAASHDPASSVPRACWPSTGGPAYTPPAPVPAPSVSEAYFFWPSAFDTSHGGYDHEAPMPWDRNGSCTLPEAPLPAQFSVHPLTQSYPRARIYWCWCALWRLVCGGRAPFGFPTRSTPGTRLDRFDLESTKELSTVKETERTQADDLGDDDVTGLSAQRYLPMPPRGPSTPPPATSARGNRGGMKAKAKAKTQAARPAPAKRTRRKIPLPPGMPKVEKVGENRYGCPHEGCSKDYSRAYDVKRHYWDHVDDKIIWVCMECFGVCTRYDNTLKHFKLGHKREALDEDILMIQCTTEQIALWGV